MLCYADDTLILADSPEQLISRLDIVLGRAVNDGLKYNLSKCTLICRQVDFLGHRIHPSGTYSPLPKHLEAIDRLTSPKTRDDLRRVLGSINFLCRYINYYNEFENHIEVKRRTFIV